MIVICELLQNLHFNKDMQNCTMIMRKTEMNYKL